MRRLAEKEQSIRAFVNDGYLYERYFRDYGDEWNTLAVALDTLGDSCSALIHFEDVGIGNTIDERYLRFYGLFQAIILQQDAIKHLYWLFVGRKLSSPPTSAWMKLRDLRNMVAGHPIDKDGDPAEGKLRIFVSQRTITSNGFTLLICEQKTGKTRSQQVDFRTSYEAYKIEALAYLSDIENAQIAKWGPLEE